MPKVTEEEFVEAFIRFWTEENRKRGVEYQDDVYSVTRMLARTLAKTIIPLLGEVY